MTADFPEKLQFLFEPARYKILHGGRGSAKSWGAARALLILAAQRKLRILCAREFQASIQDSVHKLLSEQIPMLGLAGHYQVQQASIRARSGSEFIFSGIRSNVTKIKSMEGIDIAWVEEAEKVSEASWKVLIPTVRKPGSEIWVTFNPDLETDPTYRRFVTAPPPGAQVVAMNWQDNPWFPAELARELEYDYGIDPEAADHVWGGATRKNSVAQVLRGRYVVEAFEPGSDWDGPYQGADWGFANDPTALVRLWIHERRLYVEHEAYRVGVEIDHTPALFDQVPRAREYVTRADNARPETISYMQRNGYGRMVGCTKGPGSVEDGVAHLKSYEKIVIHPRCIHFAEEARLWSFKTDRLSGDVLPELVDKWNHLMDASRYALEPVMKSAGLGLLGFMKAQVDARKPVPQPQ